MPNNPKLYNPKDIHPLKENYQDVNKNEIKFLGKVWANSEYIGETTKRPILITQRALQLYTTTGCKLVKKITNYHQQNFIG